MSSTRSPSMDKRGPVLDGVIYVQDSPTSLPSNIRDTFLREDAFGMRHNTVIINFMLLYVQIYVMKSLFDISSSLI